MLLSASTKNVAPNETAAQMISVIVVSRLFSAQ